MDFVPQDGFCFHERLGGPSVTLLFRVSHPHNTDPAHRYSHTQLQEAEDQVYTVECLPPQRVEWMVVELARERQEPHRPGGKGVPGVGAGK